MARPTLFTPDRAALIVRTIRETGCSLGAAARVAGIGESTLRDWRKRGAEELANGEPIEAAPDSPPQTLGEFVLALERELAAVESKLTKCLIDAAAKDWRAAAWWLERRRPQVYGETAAGDDYVPEPAAPARLVDAKAAAAELMRRQALGLLDGPPPGRGGYER